MTIEHLSKQHSDFAELGLTVLQRDWLSANQVVFPSSNTAPATVVDTGYGSHAAMSLALIEHALCGEPVKRIVNTHLHSDHCGGNRALQERDPTVQAWIPSASYAPASSWDETKLTYRMTGQHCERFRVDGTLSAGNCLSLGPAQWQVHTAPGHDPDAIVLFEPQTRTLIAGDALWEDRLAIIFPELSGESGFEPARATLALIERLAPRTVIPGHGRVFNDVTSAIAASRKRLDAFQQDPIRHIQHAARALLMFHMLEYQACNSAELVAWLMQADIFSTMAANLNRPLPARAWANDLIEGLIDDGLISSHQGILSVASDSGR